MSTTTVICRGNTISETIISWKMKSVRITLCAILFTWGLYVVSCGFSLCSFCDTWRVVIYCYNVPTRYLLVAGTKQSFQIVVVTFALQKYCL